MSELHAWDVPHISATIGRMPADDDLFHDLADVLKKHNALNRFGITLLHKHFEIASDEALLETTDVAGRQHLLRTVKRSELVDKDAVETAWKLGPNGEALWGCICVDMGGQHGGHRPVP